MHKGLFRWTCSGDQIKKEVLSWRKFKITGENIHTQNKRPFRSRHILCFPKDELCWARHFNSFPRLPLSRYLYNWWLHPFAEFHLQEGSSNRFLVYMLWFNFILGLNFLFFCFKLIMIHYHTLKQKKRKFKPMKKLNHNIYTTLLIKQKREGLMHCCGTDA